MSLRKILSNKFTLSAITFISGLISAYDNVMNVVFYKTLPIDERNPYASWIIDNWGVYGLVTAKTIGTVAAVILMLMLIKTKYKFVIYPVFICQAILFFYLTFYTASYTTFFNGDMGLPIEMFIEFYKDNVGREGF
tara:strand:+ start:1125 stop:1532 length:408 start_codon:yes stop_codon:yes gene_type:complete